MKFINYTIFPKFKNQTLIVFEKTKVSFRATEMSVFFEIDICYISDWLFFLNFHLCNFFFYIYLREFIEKICRWFVLLIASDVHLPSWNLRFDFNYWVQLSSPIKCESIKYFFGILRNKRRKNQEKLRLCRQFFLAFPNMIWRVKTIN